MKFKLTYIIIAIIFFTSCVSHNFIPIAAENIKLNHNRGIITPVYSDENYNISIVPKIIQSYIALQIVIKNNSNFNFYMADSFFNCYVSSDNTKWKLVKSYSSKEFYKKEYNYYIAGAVLTALSAEISSATAGLGTVKSSGSGYTYSSNGLVYNEYDNNLIYYNPTAAELARQRNQANIENYISRGEQWLSFLKSNLFYDKDLSPNEVYSGLVFYDFKPYQFLKVTVSINGIDKTTFTYKLETNF